ncbi:dual specificity protein phosphatase MPK-4-like [Thrips palmi]|uniref:Dual specificity protein phosphatase MPK-4-like n=1 Tax=Thrips palmi TaxID=161013 RepID=A0A6P8YKI0_THRPL|nr:dual specificity protein phosphatase MPK-4-like [Thrips palmi]XP_034234467.1 dual specificity protein phosphatase MPK-4-like [Thrips palmi]XP_034234468.1 dual specificity protein phosphatase MPK-4-like [Thrips palmi]
MSKLKDTGVLLREDFDAGPTNLDEIEPGLWLGNLTAATDKETLQAHGISHILTVDSCSLPNNITEQPGMVTKFIKVTDTSQEDLLSILDSAVSFIISSLENGVLLVHCYFGVSRSAAVVIAYLMQKYKISFESAFEKAKEKRRFVGPNSGFQSQLKLYHTMGWKIDPTNPQYKLFRLHCAAYHVSKARILPTAFLDLVQPDPALIRAQPEPLVYRCRKCRRIVASASNMLPHIPKESPKWTDPRLTELMQCAGKGGIKTPQPPDTAGDNSVSVPPACQETYFVEPLGWMTEVTHQQQGKLNCPKCVTKLGSFSWIMGCQCPCGAKVSPAFYLVPSKVEWSNFVQNVQVTV